jgi:choline transporter-like protein 2/4/5
VLWATSASWATCQPATLSGLPLAPGRVAAFRTCLACCGAAPPRAATCVVPVFSYAARNATRATYNPSDDGQYLSCLASCENTHDSIDQLIAAQTSTIDTTAAGLFASACTAAGAAATPVPLPSGNGTSSSEVSRALTALLTAQTAQLARYVADVANSWRTLVVCGLALPAALALSWLLLLRFAAAALVWSTVFAANGAALAGTLYCFAKAGRLGSSGALEDVSDALLSRAGNGTIGALTAPDTSSHERHMMYALGIAAAVATSLLMALTAVAVPRLRLATATLRVAVGTLGAAPALALAPLFTFFAGVAFLVWWVAAGVYMYAAGDVVRRDCCAEVQAAWADALAGVPANLVPASLAAPTCADIHCGYVVAPDWRLRGALVYHVFELLWTFHFLHAFTLLVVADVTFEAYLARGTGAAMPAAPVLHAARTAAAFYLGSLALGSLLAAFAQLWALPIAIGIYHLSRAHKLRGGDGIAAGATLCGPPSATSGVLAWSLGLLRALRSRAGPNAWALLTVEGRPYCASAKAVGALLAANEDTVAPVHAVGDTLCILGKVGIASGCAFWAFVYLDVSPPSTGIPSPLLPVIVVSITSFIVATQFIGVVQQCIETTLVAFCDDTAAHDGVATCSPPELVEALEGLKEAREAARTPGMRKGTYARIDCWLTPRVSALRVCVCVQGPCWGLRQRLPRCCGAAPAADGDAGSADAEKGGAQIPPTTVP